MKIMDPIKIFTTSCLLVFSSFSLADKSDACEYASHVYNGFGEVRRSSPCYDPVVSRVLPSCDVSTQQRATKSRKKGSRGIQSTAE